MATALQPAFAMATFCVCHVRLRAWHCLWVRLTESPALLRLMAMMVSPLLLREFAMAPLRA